MNNKFSIPVVETIKKRQSVRTYKDEMISNSDREKLLEYINVVDNPFNVPVKIHIIDKNLNENCEKLSTYGTIKGAKTFLGLSVPNVITLEMVRLAPFATNSQPWRVLKTGNPYHFYETHKQNASKEESLIKQVDLGIVLSHFHQAALEQGLNGKFEKISQKNIDIPSDTYYIISWIAE